MHICSSDIYSKYLQNTVDGLPKKIITQLVTKIFDKVIVKKPSKGPNKIIGLRPIFNLPDHFTRERLIEAASRHEFTPINERDGASFLCFSGCIVNNQKQTKTVRLSSDNILSVYIGEIEVPLSKIGLENIQISTTEDANIVFNTVKQAQVCCGKLVKKSHTVPKHSLLQQWMRNGKENGLEQRITCNRCSGVVPFTSLGVTCSPCLNQTLVSSCQPPPVSSCQPPVSSCQPPESKSEDSLSMLQNLFPGCSEVMLKLLSVQSKICCEPAKDPRTRRWDKDIVQVCLTLWNRSPQAYASLSSSGMLFLPSINLLQRYKNCFDQTSGLNYNMLTWMFKEAKRLNVDMRGGLILDEMAVQDDLKMSFYGGKNTVDGLVDMGSLAEDLYLLNQHKNELRVATHVLQFLFLSYDGFRFPFAYFPSTGANVSELYLTMWEAIAKLATYDFTIDYVCLDGASNNRALQMLHFESKDEAKSKNFTATNPYGDNQVTLIMDYSHNIKKLRNNINASGNHELCTRKLSIDDKFIVWNHWMEAFLWDRSHNSMRVHQKLTNEHIFLTNVSKMRNHLAEEVLNKDMLHLMKVYQQSLAEGSYLNKTVELLEHTSAIIELFRDRRPISDLSDARLDCLRNFENWLEAWSQSLNDLNDISASVRARMFLSRETYSDLISMIRGFSELCTKRIKHHERSLVPAGLNSDVIENIFCQQRTICHGSNTNPTVHQYKYAINATILGQNAVSKKSNASSKKRSIEPFKISKPGPLKRKCIRL